MPLYEIVDDGVRQIHSGRFSLERELQQFSEKNLEELFGVRFIATEFSTGDRQRGRIDTLGLDLNGIPTIIEYKRGQRENVINQGLFYLDWLVDHKGDFILEAQKALGGDVEVNWSSPRLILIAETFGQYDKYAVNRIGANIELWIYRLYGDTLFYLEQIYAPSGAVQPQVDADKLIVGEKSSVLDEVEAVPVYTLDDHLKKTSAAMQDAFQMLREKILDFAEDEGEIVETPNKLYVAYRHGKNFAEIVFQARALRIFLDIPVNEFDFEVYDARDVSNVGHWGTGDVEVRVKKLEDVRKVLPLIEQSFLYTL